MAQMVNNPPAMQETWVQSLGLVQSERSRGAGYFSWVIPWTEELGRL